MDTSDIQELIDDLSGNLDDLEASLAPILSTALSASTSKLPLLDKAKLYVLATYALDSVLFSLLKLNGTDVKTHPVVAEINRVKSYFGKIKEAETGPAQRSAVLDKDAAARFIKHGLAGNEKYDNARQEKMAAEKARTKSKADEFEASAQYGSGNRFTGMAKRMKAEEPSITVVKATELSDDDDEAGAAQTSSPEQSKEEKKAAKHQRRMERKLVKQSPVDEAEEQPAASSAPAQAKTGPKSNHDTFQALLNGSLPAQPAKKKKRKSRSEAQDELENKRMREMM
jgi:exosome complex protein LRP1